MLRVLLAPRFLSYLFASCFGLLLSACAAVDVVKMKEHPAKPINCALDVYADEKEITREYEVVCLISSMTGSTLFDKKTASEAIRLAKPKACECGADAILIMATEKKGMSATGYGHGQASIKAIRYK